MKISADKLIHDLEIRTRQVLEDAAWLKILDENLLHRKPSAKGWSALECIEHLNMFGDHYVEEILNRIRTSKHPPEPVFRSGIFGNWFARVMSPDDLKIKTPTLPGKNPAGSDLDKRTLDKFIDQQNHMLTALSEARQVSLNRTKAAIIITPLIKFRLGDILRIFIYHNQRHMRQAQRAVDHAQKH